MRVPFLSETETISVSVSVTGLQLQSVTVIVTVALIVDGYETNVQQTMKIASLIFHVYSYFSHLCISHLDRVNRSPK